MTKATKIGCVVVIFMIVSMIMLVGIIKVKDSNDKRQVNEIKKEMESLKKLIGERQPTRHIVKKGESIYAIARDYAVLEYQIRQWNNLEIGCLIYPGQELKIKKVEWRAYTGRASWYGPGFHGKKMANCETYNQDKVLIAHRNYPLGLNIRITNLINGKVIVAPVLDRGPYAKDKKGRYDREVDLSRAAAKILGAIEPGVIPVRIEPLSS